MSSARLARLIEPDDGAVPITVTVATGFVEPTKLEARREYAVVTGGETIFVPCAETGDPSRVIVVALVVCQISELLSPYGIDVGVEVNAAAGRTRTVTVFVVEPKAFEAIKV